MVACDIACVHFTGSYACPRGRRWWSEIDRLAWERRLDLSDSQSESPAIFGLWRYRYLGRSPLAEYSTNFL
jgi:predicted esterase